MGPYTRTMGYNAVLDRGGGCWGFGGTPVGGAPGGGMGQWCAPDQVAWRGATPRDQRAHSLIFHKKQAIRSENR